MDRIDLPRSGPGDTPAAQHLRPCRRRGLTALLLAALLYPALALIWRRSLPVTFFALTGDDFHRTLLGWEVTRGNLLPSDLWPPLQFWLEALLLQVYPHLLSVPSLINLGCAALTLAALALLCRTLGLGGGPAGMALALAASTPWFIWLSLSGLTDSIFVCLVTLAYLGVAAWRSGSGARGLGLWSAALALLAAGMARFDGWGHSAAFTLGVAWLWWRAPRPRPRGWLAAAAAPWAFPAFWLSWQYARHGDPLFFSRSVRAYFLALMGPQPLQRLLTWQLSDLWAVAGLAAALGALGTALLWRRPGVPLMAAMWLTSLGLLVASTLTHTISVSSPTRQVLVHALLLTPGAARLIWRWGRRPRAIPALALALALVGARLAAVPGYSSYLPADVQATGSHLGALRTLGVWRPGERAMVEVQFWDYILLTVLSDDPGAVVYDRPPTLVVLPGGEQTLDDAANPSLLALPPGRLLGELRARRVRVVVAYSGHAVAGLRQIARQSEHAGRFYVFVVDP